MTIIPPEKTDDGKITIGGLDANVWMTKYGNVYTDCKAKDFMGKLGFSWGDLVTVKFLDKTLTLPVVPTYSYVDSGKPAIIVEKDADGKLPATSPWPSTWVTSLRPMSWPRSTPTRIRRGTGPLGRV